MVNCCKNKNYGCGKNKPLWIVYFIVQYPKTSALLSLLIPIALSIWAVFLPLQIDKRTDAFRDNNHMITKSYDAYQAGIYNRISLKAHQNKRSIFNTLNQTTPDYYHQLQHSEEAYFLIYYVAKSPVDNLFLESIIKNIHSIEQTILSDPEYQKYCVKHTKKTVVNTKGEIQLPENEWRDECKTPISLMNFFYPTINQSETRKYLMFDVLDWDGKGEDMYDVNAVKTVISYIDELNRLLDRQFTRWNQKTRVIVTYLYWGFPLAGFENTTWQNDTSLRNQQGDVLLPYLKKLAKFLATKSNSQFDICYAGSIYTDWEIDQTIYRDLALAIGSIALVFAWIWVHTKSFFLTCGGMFHIILSLPAGFFTIRVIMNVPEVSVLMAMSIFIIIGIGTDDIFILYDMWMQAQHEPHLKNATILQKLDWAYRHSFWAMFGIISLLSNNFFIVTSLTSAIAFASNGFSQIIPIKLFGIFMAMIVTVNFYLICTWFTALIVIWNSHFVDRFNCCCSRFPSFCPTKVVDPTRENTDEIEMSATQELHSDTNNIELNSDSSTEEDVLTNLQPSIDTESKSTSYGLVQTFLYNIYSPKYIVPFYVCLVLYRLNTVRWLVLIAFIFVLIGGIYSAFQLKYNYLCYVTNFYRGQAGDPQFFPPGTNIRCFSDVDEYIRPKHRNSQVVLTFGIKGVDTSKANPFKREVGEPIFSNNFDLSDPGVQSHLLELDKSILSTKYKNGYLVKQLSQDQHSRFFTAFETWLSSVYNQTIPIYNKDQFWERFKQFLDGHNTYAADIGWSDSDRNTQVVKWGSFAYESEIDLEESSALVKQEVYNTWNNAINMKHPLGDISIVNEYFVNMVTELVLVTTAVYGTIASLILALVVLVLSTRNLITSVLSILSLFFVVILLFIFFHLMAWTISFIESVALTLVVGISIDYIIHYIIAYTNQSEMIRDITPLELVRLAFVEKGTSIFSGAVTTSTAVFLLFFCTITFFSKFGIFVFVTIVSSFIIAFLLLPALLLVTPVSKGNIKEIWMSLKEKCCVKN